MMKFFMLEAYINECCTFLAYEYAAEEEILSDEVSFEFNLLNIFKSTTIQ